MALGAAAANGAAGVIASKSPSCTIDGAAAHVAVDAIGDATDGAVEAAMAAAAGDASTAAAEDEEGGMPVAVYRDSTIQRGRVQRGCAVLRQMSRQTSWTDWLVFSARSKMFLQLLDAMSSASVASISERLLGGS
jgi:hypothetical protein